MSEFNMAKTRIESLLGVLVSIACIFCMCFASGCSNSNDEKQALKAATAEKPGSDANDKPALTHVGGRSITANELKNYLADRAMTGADTTPRDMVKQRLEEMILEELLYQEALRLKLDQTHEMRERMRQLLIQKLLDEQVNKQSWKREIAEDEIVSYYEKHRDEFERPEQVRLADIFIAVPAGAGKGARIEARKKGELVLAEALATKNERNGFGLLIEKYSDTPADHRKGDTDFFDREGEPAGVDHKIAKAAFELERNGDIYEQVIEAVDGYHIIMRIGKRAAVSTPLAKVRGHLEKRIRRESIEKGREAYFAKLRQEAEVLIEEEGLSEVVREIEAEQVEAGVVRIRRQDSGPPRIHAKDK